MATVLIRFQRPYDIHMRSGPQVFDYKWIAERIALDRPQAILDWGCGFGILTALLHEYGLNVTALDHHPTVESLRTETLMHYPHLERIMTPDPVALPFANQSFDAVVSCGVLEHVADPDGSLQEIYRVLQPGGTFYVFKLPNSRSWLEKVAKYTGLYYHGKHPHDRVYTMRGARNLLERAGFHVREAWRANVLPLTIPLDGKPAEAWWWLNKRLTRPFVAVATNVELIAQRPRV